MKPFQTLYLIEMFTLKLWVSWAFHADQALIVQPSLTEFYFYREDNNLFHTLFKHSYFFPQIVYLKIEDFMKWPFLQNFVVCLSVVKELISIWSDRTLICQSPQRQSGSSPGWGRVHVNECDWSDFPLDKTNRNWFKTVMTYACGTRPDELLSPFWLLVLVFFWLLSMGLLCLPVI